MATPMRERERERENEREREWRKDAAVAAIRLSRSGGAWLG